MKLGEFLAIKLLKIVLLNMACIIALEKKKFQESLFTLSENY